MSKEVSSKILPVDTMIKRNNDLPLTMARFGKFCEYIFNTLPVDDGSTETYSTWLMRWEDALANLYYEHVKSMQ